MKLCCSKIGGYWDDYWKVVVLAVGVVALVAAIVAFKFSLLEELFDKDLD